MKTAIQRNLSKRRSPAGESDNPCDKIDRLLSFLALAEQDPRVCRAHITLYVALWKKWCALEAAAPLVFYRREVEALSKINSTNTFHRILRQLHEFGYLRYEPSFNPALGNLIYLKS